jgi:iron(III) transport system substrate-binding protein
VSPSSSLTKLSLLLPLGLALVGCGGGGASPGAPSASPANSTASAAPATSGPPVASPEPTLVVYSGRSEELVGPILERFETATGIDIAVRYAGTTELATTILEEGDNSPADVFFSQDGGALGALAEEGRLTALPADVLELVDSRFRSADGRWVGVSGRARVLAYDARELVADDLPASVLGLTDPSWKGRIGWAPTNASFQTFVTALRVKVGEEGARDWLTRMQANAPKVYEGNAAALEAVRTGEIDVALINHYYLFQAQAESGEEYPVANHYFSGGDPGALVNVAGVGILDGADHPIAADRLVRFLLAGEAQTYFSDETYEYPLATGVAADPRLPALDEIESPDLDLSDLRDLNGTLTLLTEVGIL